MKLTYAVQQYVNFYLVAERQYTKATVKTYIQRLGLFVQYVKDMEIESITKQMIDMYNLYLHNKGIGLASITAYLVVVRGLFKYTRRE